MKSIYVLIALLISFSLYGKTSYNDKCRIIVTTDLGGTDPDDRQSLIHLLVSANLIDIEGIISSQVWITDSDKTDHILKMIDGYATAYTNLSRHAKGFPSPSFLKSVTMRGQAVAGIDGVGENMDSPGSDFIIATADKNDSRPLWILAWGGMNTLAQAIYKVEKTRTAKELDAFLKKIRVYDVLGQDDAGAWITRHYPEIFYIRNKDVYGWQQSDDWIKANIQSVLPLGAIYPNRIWAFEGDTPSFLYLLANGVNDPENVSYGGWGGRFNKEKQPNIPAMDWVRKNNMDEMRFGDYYMFGSAPEGLESIKRWSEHIWNDIAIRMIWASTPDFSKANHHPVININKNSRLVPLRVKAKAGETVKLDASRTKDPDKNDMSFSWEIYGEPGYAADIASLSHDFKSPTCHITIPTSASGNELHVILTVKDNGTPALTSCRRVVIEVM